MQQEESATVFLKSMIRRHGPSLLLGLSALAVQLFILTAGRWTLSIQDLPTRYTTTFYGEQARAFLNGSLALLPEPPDALLRLPDPYDPAARRGIDAMHDATLYKGKYFLYFGPGPALLLLPIQFPSGSAPVADSLAVLLLTTTLTLATAGIFHHVRRRLFPAMPWPVAAAVFYAIALGNPMLYTLARPAVYEAAILGGQAGIVAGLFFGLKAIRSSRPLVWGLLAGTGFGFAVLSRLTLVPAVALLTLYFGGLLLRRSASRMSALKGATAVAAPTVVAAGLLGWYNFARFDSPFETGHRYQLTLFPLLAEYGRFFSLDYLAANLYSFLVRGPDLGPVFPFVRTPDPVLSDLPRWTAPSSYLILEPTIGLFASNPMLLASVIAAIGVVLLAVFRLRKSGASRPPGGSQVKNIAGLSVLLLGTAALAGFPDVLQRYMTMRYELDVSTLLGLAGFTALGVIYSTVAAARTLVTLTISIAAGVLSALAIAVGVLLGFQGYYHHFQTHNPALFVTLARPTIPAAGASRTPPGDAVIDRRVDAAFEGIGTLGSVSFPAGLQRNGDRVRLVFKWRSLLPGASGASANYRLLQSGYRPILETNGPLPAVSPAGDGESSLEFALPDSIEGPDFLFLEVQVYPSGGSASTIRDAAGNNAGSSITAGPIHLAGPGTWPPPGSTSIDTWFGVEMHLSGLRIDAPDSGPNGDRSLPVALYWDAPRYPDRLVDKRTVRVSLIDRDNRTIGESRSEPGDGWFTTIYWIPGDMVIDEHDVPVPGAFELRGSRLRVEVDGPNGPVEPNGLFEVALDR